MKINLSKDAKIKKGCTIIEGFPGFGLVGPIATEFLIEHLGTKLVGEFVYHDLPATTAIHNGKVVRPMGLHYDEKRNILIFHTILSVKGKEWAAAEELIRIAEQCKAKEILSLEGVNAMVPGKESQVYSFGNEKLEKLGAQQIQESIIMGVTAAMLLKTKNTTCLFAETQSGLPDSKAAAAILATLDKYLALNIDLQPLQKQAQEFELKLKSILSQTQKTMDDAERKELSYLG